MTGPPDTAPRLPTVADIEAAAIGLAGHAVHTPLLESPLLNDRLGGRVLIKAESLQRTGSFKFRGAFTRIRQIPTDDRARGVVAFSSGNHAQGVAAAARLLGIAATIVMPADAPSIKRSNTAAWGATVVAHHRYREDREAVAAEIVVRTGATLIRPFDDPGVIAGQGTVGLELSAQLRALDVRPDAVLVPCGGGGLTAGIALALADSLRGVPVHPVEPADFDDTRRSLEGGARVANAVGRSSICDSLLSAMPGVLTFAINRRLAAPALIADDDAVRWAVALAFDCMKLVVEPGGAIGLAALLADPTLIAGRTVVIVASGGNVDPARFSECLAAV